MRGWLVTAFALLGCTKQNPDFCPNHPDDPRCGGMADAGTDGGAADAEIDGGISCYGSGAFEVCPMGAATGTVTLSGALDTATSTQCHADQLWKASGQPDSCFIVGQDVTIQNVTVTGTRPLVIVASGELTLSGHLDAASHVSPSNTGPGVPASPCGNFPTAPQNATGAGGGAGASLAQAGGGGGTGGTGQNGTSASGAPYAPFLATPPGVLRGGCDGQNGGNGQGTGGIGGRGGGAVYLVSGTRMTLGASSIINASGSGAQAANKSAGGGGGGTGGMILLHAPSFSIATGAIVLANGGSGGSGGNGNGGGTGVRGNDPSPTNPMQPAGGGTGVGGTGGNGYALGTLATGGGNGGSNEGGGGGGGGGGYIQSNLPLTNATVSPAPNLAP